MLKALVVVAVSFIAVIKNLFKKSNKPKMLKEEIIEPIKAQTKTKNKWLYPADEFGKMEKGVARN